MKDLIIVGAGGMGRKLFSTINRINSIDPKWNILGFIDDDLQSFANVKIDSVVIGKISDWIPQDNQYFVMGITDVFLKEKISNSLKDRKAKFVSIISPEAIIGDYVEIGEGSIILTPYNIESGVKIGKFVTLLGSTIALDGEIGDFSTTAGFANLTNAKIGKKVYIASHVVLTENIEIGDNSVVGVGSIVLKNVSSNTKVFGYPARVFQERGNNNE